MKKISVVITLILITILATPANAIRLLIPGGQVVGMALEDKTVSVAAFDEELGTAAKTAGLKEGDRILRIDETAIASAEDVRTALSQSDGQVDIYVMRGNKAKHVCMCPIATESGPKLGIYLKQGTTGVGTVTYYDPQSKEFGALGHGVNTQAGNLLELTKGSVYSARVASVKKGKVGTPGQLVGALQAPDATGSLDKNSQQGVFGKMTFTPKTEMLPVATAQQIHTGAATIRSTVEGENLQEYSVEILKIYPNASQRNRNMLLKVTDPRLLETTGGIVQGMSGSPIIQDGKLIGAVTHVLVNDPTTGYGIFIENMLDAAA